MLVKRLSTLVIVSLLLAVLAPAATVAASRPTYDLINLAGNVASFNGTAGLQISYSAFIQEDAEEGAGNPVPGAPISPAFVVSSPLDGSSVAAPAVTVNQDTAGAPQNKTSIA